MLRQVYKCIVVLLFVAIGWSFSAYAQPTLPDIAGYYERGFVFLNWQCQYDGIQAITVSRSLDSGFNYNAIGKVLNLKRGIQGFVDGHPAMGKNYYKLTVVFKSGLSWTCHKQGVLVDTLDLVKRHVRLDNASLQALLIAPHWKPTPPKELLSELKKKTNVVPNGSQIVAKNSVDIPISKQAIYTSPVHNVQKNNIDLPQKLAETIVVDVPRKISLTLPDETIEDINTGIKTKYIYNDLSTKMVMIVLPDDYKLKPYTLQFYDEDNTVIMDVPKMCNQKMIIDKRNFQHRQPYKFILRREGLAVETGYVNSY